MEVNTQAMDRKGLIEFLKSKVDPKAEFTKDNKNILLMTQMSCGCARSYKTWDDLPEKSDKCPCGNYYIQYLRDTTRYKVSVDKNHPAGEVVFILPYWASKETPANADDCYIWSNEQLLKSGLKDGDLFDIDRETGIPKSQVEQERLSKMLELFTNQSEEFQASFATIVSYDLMHRKEMEFAKSNLDNCLDIIKMIKGEEFLEEVKTCIEESDHTFSHEFVDTHKGTLTDGFYFCNQTENGGITGDSFAGSIYIPIIEDRMFFKFRYEM